MDGKSLTAVFASKAFRKLMEESRDRLACGAALRESMRCQIEAGIVPTGYRAACLDHLSDEIITLLCAAAEKFNREHPDDLFSAADFLDALASSRKKIMDGVHQFQASLAANTESRS